MAIVMMIIRMMIMKITINPACNHYDCELRISQLTMGHKPNQIHSHKNLQRIKVALTSALQRFNGTDFYVRGPGSKISSLMN